MPRSVPGWIGKTDDTSVPPHVKLRVFRAHNGVCHRTGRKIWPGDKWDTDHIKPLIVGGENIESNLAPILTEAHKEKTKEEMAVKAKSDAVAKKHLGIKKATDRPIPGSKASGWKKKIDGTVERR